MDNITLSKFIQSSRTNYRICHQILTDREENYKNKIEEIINAVKNAKGLYLNNYLTLLSNHKDRQFRLAYFINEGFRITEQVIPRNFALYRLGYQTYKFSDLTAIYDPTTRNYKISNLKEIKEILLDLFMNGYLSGDYKPVTGYLEE